MLSIYLFGVCLSLSILLMREFLSSKKTPKKNLKLWIKLMRKAPLLFLFTILVFLVLASLSWIAVGTMILYPLFFEWVTRISGKRKQEQKEKEYLIKLNRFFLKNNESLQRAVDSLIEVKKREKHEIKINERIQ